MSELLDRTTIVRRVGYDAQSMLPFELPFLLGDLQLAGAAKDDAKQTVDALRSAHAIAPAKLVPLAEHPSPSITRLCAALDGTAEAPATSNACDAEGGITLVKWQTPEDELAGMAQFVQAAVHRAEHPLEAMRVCVVAPDARWAHLAEQALAHRRLAVSMPRARLGFSGDARKPEAARALEAFARLRLLADAGDAVGWRASLGLGERNLGCAAWKELVAHARAIGAAPLDALAALDDPHAFPQAAQVIEKRDAVRAFNAAKGGLRGLSLAGAIGADDLPEFEEALDALEPGDGAAEMLARELAAYGQPRFSAQRDAVRVATYETLTGSADEFDLVWALACVDGLVGDGQGQPAIAPGADAHAPLLAHAFALTRRDLVISYFSQATPAVASRAHLPVARTRTSPAGDVSVLRPAPFIARVGDALPGALGGQYLLAGL